MGTAVRHILVSLCLVLSTAVYADQQIIEVQLVLPDGTTRTGQLTVESDPTVVGAVWRVVTFGIPDALFHSQGQNYGDYLSRPRYVRALTYKDGETEKSISLGEDDTNRLLHYFQNPVPGNVWAVKTEDGDYSIRRLSGLQIEVKPGKLWGQTAGEIKAGLLERDEAGATKLTWKSMRNGEVAQIYRPEASIAYRSESASFPRVVVDRHPAAFAKIEGQRVPIRILGETEGKIEAVAAQDYAKLSTGQEVPSFDLPSSAIFLAGNDSFVDDKPESSANSMRALEPFRSSSRSSLPVMKKGGCGQEILSTLIN